MTNEHLPRAPRSRPDALPPRLHLPDGVGTDLDPEHLLQLTDLVHRPPARWRWTVAALEVAAPFAVGVGVPLALGWPAPVAVALGALGAGATDRGLAQLLHLASHRAVCPTRAGNERVGRVAGALVGQDLERYRSSHVRHHAHEGDPEKDPDLAEALASGIYDVASRREFLWRFLVLPLFGSTVAAYWRFVLEHRSQPGAVRRLAAAAGAAYVASFALGPVGGVVRIVLVAWAIGLAVVYPIIGNVVEASEHYPVAAYERGPLATRHRACGPVSRWCFGLVSERYHLTHHVLPKLPHWRMRQAHRILLTSPTYRARATADGGTWRPFGLTRQLLGAYDRLVDLRRAAAPLDEVA